MYQDVKMSPGSRLIWRNLRSTYRYRFRVRVGLSIRVRTDAASVLRLYLFGQLSCHP